MRITKSRIRTIIRETVTRIPPGITRPASFAYGESPDPQSVYDAFVDLGGIEQGEVSENDLANHLGVEPGSIDYNGTSLMMLNGFVKETL